MSANTVFPQAKKDDQHKQKPHEEESLSSEFVDKAHISEPSCSYKVEKEEEKHFVSSKNFTDLVVAAPRDDEEVEEGGEKKKKKDKKGLKEKVKEKVKKDDKEGEAL